MGRFQPPVEPSTVWLRDLVEAMDEVATSAAKPSATDREAFANRLELPAMLAPPGTFIRPPSNHPRDQARQQPSEAKAATRRRLMGRASASRVLSAEVVRKPAERFQRIVGGLRAYRSGQ
jgi:hypothetical protein